MRIVGNDPTLSRQLTATASGAISAAGKPLVVNTDGTVQFAGSTTVTTTIGSANTFTSAAILGTDITFDSNSNRVVISYRDGGNSDYGTAIVGEVNASNNTISFGTPVVFESAATNQTSIDFDSTANKVLIAYEDDANSDYGTAIVGTVDPSDNSISFGSAAVFESAAVNYITTRFDPDNSKFLIVYKDEGNSNYGTAIVATISGTSVSFGSPTVYRSGQVDFNSCIYDTNANKFLVTYRNFGASGDGIVGTISGTSVSFGSATAFHSSGSTIYVNGTDQRYGMSFDSTANKILIAYIAYISSSIGYVVVGTISGTSVSFGSYVALGSALENERNEVAYDSNTNKHLLMTSDLTGPDTDGSDITNVREVTISGTTPTVGSKVLVSDLRESTNNALVFDSNAKKIVMAYAFGGNSNYGTANVVQTSGTVENLTTENFIGTSAHAAADGAKVLVNTQGAIDSASGAKSTSDTVGTAVVFESGDTYTYQGSVYDSNSDRIVIFYRDGDDSNYGKAIVGTVSGNSVTFGTAVTFISEAVSGIRAVFDSNSNKVVVFYKNGADSEGRAHVGTVDPSDNSISFGSEATFNAGNSYAIGAAFDSTNNKIVVCFRDFGDSSKGKAVVGTVSGTSISFGSEVEFDDSYTNYHSTVFDPDTGKTVNFYQDQGNSSYGTAIVGTVSGTSISFGTPVVFNSGGNTHYIEAIYDTTANKMIVAYSKNHDSNHGAAIVGTVSGTSISFGTATEFAAASSLYTKPVYVSHLDKTVIGYQDAGDSNKGTYIVGTVSGTDISFNSEAVYSANDTSFNDTLYDPTAKKVIFSYRDGSSSNNGTVTVLDVAGGDVDLTAGQTYFVQTDGTLSETADSPSVTAGTALSATKLLVKG